MSTENITKESLTVTSRTIEALKEKEQQKPKSKKHLFKKGEVANPNGRPRGSKNKVTLLKEAVLMEAEDLVLRKFKDIVEKTIELAENGDSTCMKIIWDRVLPKDIDKQSKKDDKMNITINIEGLQVRQVNDIDAKDIVDGELIEKNG
jgi:hypothetical protein